MTRSPIWKSISTALGAEIASPTRYRRDREETAGGVWED